MSEQKISELQSMVDRSKRIVFFGGAGVSTESGIPDYRSVDGLYHQKFKYPPETMLSSDFFYSHTEDFYEFYRAKMIAPGAQPNPAHIKLAELEKAGKLTAVITQNIDGLHQAAGSRSVYELHGSVRRNYCLGCGKKYGLEIILDTEGVPKCPECGGTIKPDVVLYGEPLDQEVLEGAVEKLSKADMLIIGGTSMTVYPAAGLVRYFRGGDVAVINKSSIGMGGVLEINDSIGAVLEKIKVNV